MRYRQIQDFGLKKTVVVFFFRFNHNPFIKLSTPVNKNVDNLCLVKKIIVNICFYET